MILRRQDTIRVRKHFLFRNFPKNVVLLFGQPLIWLVDIGSIHNVEGTGLGQEMVEDVDVVELAVADEDKRRNAATQIEQRVKLHSGFSRSEGCPGEHRKAKIDCGRVERVNSVFQLYAERFFGIEPPRDPDQVLGEIAVDAPVTRCVGIGQSVAGYIAADTEMIELRAVCSQAGLNVAQTLAPCELHERHAQILVETGEMLDLVLAILTSDGTSKGRQRHVLHDLSENEFTLVHRRAPQ